MQSTAKASNPSPRPKTDLDEAFWAHCAEQRLCFQRCTRCERWRHLPRMMCPDCGSDAWTWQPSSGRGRLFSWTVSHRAPHPAFAAEVPYTVALVELEEGVRMVSGLREVSPEALQLDLPLEVVFESLEGGGALPFFRPRKS